MHVHECMHVSVSMCEGVHMHTCTYVYVCTCYATCHKEENEASSSRSCLTLYFQNVSIIDWLIDLVWVSYLVVLQGCAGRIILSNHWGESCRNRGLTPGLSHIERTLSPQSHLTDYCMSILISD